MPPSKKIDDDDAGGVQGQSTNAESSQSRAYRRCFLGRSLNRTAWRGDWLDLVLDFFGALLLMNNIPTTKGSVVEYFFGNMRQSRF